MNELAAAGACPGTSLATERGQPLAAVLELEFAPLKRLIQ